MICTVGPESCNVMCDLINRQLLTLHARKILAHVTLSDTHIIYIYAYISYVSMHVNYLFFQVLDVPHTNISKPIDE